MCKTGVTGANEMQKVFKGHRSVVPFFPIFISYKRALYYK